MINNNDNKRYTKESFEKIAQDNGFTYDQLKALTDARSLSVGFLTSYLPKIVFFPDVFVDEVRTTGLVDISEYDLEKDFDPVRYYAEPKKLYKLSYDYNGKTYTNTYENINHILQHEHMEDCLNNTIKRLEDDNEANREKLRECSRKAATWGIGQILGKEFTEAGFEDLTSFINAMYESEEKQLEAFAKYANAKSISNVEDLNKIGREVI